jgi:hypothetical protein
MMNKRMLPAPGCPYTIFFDTSFSGEWKEAAPIRTHLVISSGEENKK